MPKNAYRPFFLAICLLSPSSALTHKSPAYPDLRADIQHMVTTLEEVHPNLYHALPKAVFQTQLQNALAAAPLAHKRLEAWKTLAPLVNALRDGHTTALRPDQDIINAFSHNTTRLFPVSVKMGASHRLVVAQDFGSELLKGDEILAINQQPSAEILAGLAGFVPGETQNFQYRQLAEDFGTYLWLGIGSITNFELQIQRGDKTHNVSMPGLPLRELKKQWRSQDPTPKAEKDYTFTVLEHKFGLIDFNRFHDLEAFQAFLKEAFHQVSRQGLAYLIIDLRGNGGGNSGLGNELMAYLANKPFRQYAQIQVKVSRQIKAYYGCDQSTPAPECWQTLREAPIGSILKSDLGFLKPHLKRFKGHTVVLIDGKTFSSAADFAAMAQDFQAATLIGEETGGLASSYGDSYPFKLPNTHLEVHVSHKYFVRPNGQTSIQGVRPDFTVLRHAPQLSAQDEQIAFAKAFLLKQSVSVSPNNLTKGTPYTDSEEKLFLGELKFGDQSTMLEPKFLIRTSSRTACGEVFFGL